MGRGNGLQDRRARVVTRAGSNAGSVIREVKKDLHGPRRYSVRPGPGRPKGSHSGPAPRHPVPKKADSTDKKTRQTESPRLKPKLRVYQVTRPELSISFTDPLPLLPYSAT